MVYVADFGRRLATSEEIEAYKRTDEVIGKFLILGGSWKDYGRIVDALIEVHMNGQKPTEFLYEAAKSLGLTVQDLMTWWDVDEDDSEY